MLIGKEPCRPNLERVRHVKEALHEALSLSHDTTVTATELACLEESCASVETAIDLFWPNAPKFRSKLHKPTDTVDAEDLVQVCTEWGFAVQIAVPAPILQEN